MQTHSYIYRQFSEFLLVFLIIKAVTINSYKKIIFSQQLDKDNEFLTLATCLFKELETSNLLFVSILDTVSDQTK